jgi:hypothetical protein
MPMLNITIPNHIIHKSQINKNIEDISELKLSDVTEVLGIKQIQNCDSVTVTDGKYGFILKSNLIDLEINTRNKMSRIKNIIDNHQREFTFY